MAGLILAAGRKPGTRGPVIEAWAPTLPLLTKYVMRHTGVDIAI